jgi:hypothetical protein
MPSKGFHTGQQGQNNQHIAGWFACVGFVLFFRDECFLDEEDDEEEDFRVDLGDVTLSVSLKPSSLLSLSEKKRDRFLGDWTMLGTASSDRCFAIK